MIYLFIYIWVYLTLICVSEMNDGLTWQVALTAFIWPIIPIDWAYFTLKNLLKR